MSEGIAASRVADATGAMVDKRTLLARRTWELELFISGAVVFTLVRMPGRLSVAFDRLMVRLDESNQAVTFLGYTYVQLAIVIMTVALLIHLVARALWVGLIGLDAVFPRGIRWTRITSSGPRMKAFYRARIPRLPTLIERLDAFCNTIFSVAFAFVVIFVASIFVVGPLAWLAAWADERYFGGERFVLAFYGVLLVIFGPLMLLQLLDRRLPRHPPRPRLGRLVRAVMRPYHALFGGQIYVPISFTLLSNVPKRSYWLGFAGIFAVLMVGVMLANLVRIGVLGFDSYRFMPVRGGGRAVEAVHYERLWKPSKVYTNPSIEDDVVEGAYVRLFLPYVPASDNDLIAERCGDLEPFRSSGLSLRRRRARPLEADHVARVDQAVDCFGGLHTITLDGAPVEARTFDFYEHPVSGLAGLMGHVPLRDMTPGRHELRVRYRVAVGDDPSDAREHVIPFWN